ncbi:MAG: hypothetical protein ABR583_06925 [Gaiellaceae bacterium]
MSARTCPEWPALLDVAPDLQFKHYTVAEAHLPADALMALSGGSHDELTICCDLEQHVFYAGHTDGAVAQALRETHWYELREWATSGPGATGG